MTTDINQIRSAALSAIKSTDSAEALKDVERDYLGKKGQVTGLLKGVKDLSIEEANAKLEANKLQMEPVIQEPVEVEPVDGNQS